MSKIKSFLINNKFLFIAIITYCVLLYIYFYSKGGIVLGGEGNYWIDFNIYLKTCGYTWLNYGIGLMSTSSNSVFSYPLIMSLIDNVAIRSFLIVSLIYILPLVVIYSLLSALVKDKRLVIWASLFFVVNPFSVLLLYTLNSWGIHTFFIYPLYFLVFFKCYDNNKKLFFVFGITSLFFSYVTTNPPQLVLASASLTVLLLLVQIFKFGKVFWLEWLKKSVIVYASLFLFNIWWIVQWVIAMEYANQIYTVGFAKSWLAQVSQGVSLIFKDIFSFLWQVNPNPTFNFFSYFYNLPWLRFIFFIPFLLILYWLIFESKKSGNKTKVYSLLGFSAFIILFLKSTNYPFKNFLAYCFDYVPLCRVFKTAPEKFGVLFIFIITLILFFVLRDIKNKWVVRLFYLYIIIALIPFFTGNFIPDYKWDQDHIVSRKYVDLPEYKSFREDMQNKKLDGRLLSLPNSGIYQVMMHLHDNIYYTGMDPILANIPQSYLADYSADQLGDISIKDIFRNFDSKVSENLLPLFSIRDIHLNQKLIPWFDNPTGKTLTEEEEILNRRYSKAKEYPSMLMYVNSNYLPHFYTPETIVISSGDPAKELLSIVGGENYQIRTATYFTAQNPGKINYPASAKQNNNPVLEFDKINIIKYRIRVHQANGNFPLVFSEGYSKYWKIYLGANNPLKIINKNELLQQVNSNYKILDGNENDQADKNEVASFVNSGWISSLGQGKEKIIAHHDYFSSSPNNVSLEKYKINFVSQNFQGTIQNDNLPAGNIWETWFQKPVVGEENHFTVNGYANSWVIDVAKICQEKPGQCVKNPDGSYDLELVVDFWPQRLFYMGFTVSGLASLVGVIYLLGNYRKKRDEKKLSMD